MKYIGEERRFGITITTRFLLEIFLGFWFIIVIGAIDVSALSINEIEQNPTGTDAGNEWIELYSENNIDLNGYYLQADDNIYNLNGSFSGFFIVYFDSQFLDNTKEIIYLKDENGIIDETIELSDSKNNGKTWQICENDWIFEEGTKEGNNDCGIVTLPPNNSEDLILNFSDEKELLEVSKADLKVVKEKEFVKVTKKIVLNSPEKKENYVSKQQKVRQSVFYSFLVFCVILIVLLAWRKL